MNRKRFAELSARGAVHPSGRAVFDERDQRQRGRYTYEQRPRRLERAQEEEFRQDRKAWEFFEAQPPHYRRLAAFFVLSAVKEETRMKRLQVLIESSRNERRLGMLTGRARKEDSG